MSVSDEPREIMLARLKLAPSEIVFEELKAGLGREGDNIVEPIEAALLRRREPLIDLGLARFGTSESIVSQLLTRALAPSAKEDDADHLTGLRVCCYGNERLGGWATSGDLLRQIATAEQIEQIITQGDLARLIHADDGLSACACG